MSAEIKIPDGWEVKTIDQLAEVIGGGTPKRNNDDNWTHGCIEWVTPSDITSIKNSNFITQAKEKITEYGLNNSSSKLLPSNSILLTSRATIGARKINTIPMCTNQGFTSLVPKKDNTKYIFYMLEIYKNYMYSRAYGTTFPEISRTEVKNVQVILPKMKIEQQHIVKILSTLDEAIEASHKLITKEKNIKKGLMHDLLSNGIDENGKIRSPQTHEYKESKLGLIPEGWDESVLGAIVEIIGGGTPSRSIDEYWENGTIPWVTVKDLHNKIYITDCEEKITLSSIDNSATNLIKANNIITSTRMGIGRFFINTVDITINQDLKALISKVGTDIMFLLWSLLYHGEKLEALGTGTTVKGILLSDLKALELLLPPSEEQKQIAKILISQDKKIETEEKNLLKLEELKKGLMSDLLSGKMRVKI